MASDQFQLTCSERTFAMDIFHGFIEPNNALTEPSYRIDAARAVRRQARDVAAARCPSYAEVAAGVRWRPRRWRRRVGGGNTQ